MSGGTPNRAVISLQDVHKVYRMGESEVRALDGVTLDFDAGSFSAIMGKSGSGKSTMLNLLGCLDRPTSGRYFLDGIDVSELDDDQLSGIRLQKLGFVFQSFNLIAQLTVQENIELQHTSRRDSNNMLHTLRAWRPEVGEP
jgi:putative ABC transport system ATP-binding protein